MVTFRFGWPPTGNSTAQHSTAQHSTAIVRVSSGCGGSEQLVALRKSMATVLVSCLWPDGLRDQMMEDKGYIICCYNKQAVPLLWRSDAGLSLRRSGFDPASVHVRFVVDKVAM